MLLGGHHAAHEFNSGVVLPTVPVLFGLHSDFCQLLLVWFQTDIQTGFGLRGHGNNARLVAYGAKRDVPALMTLDRVVAVNVRNGCHLMPLVDDTCKWYTISSLGINDNTMNLLTVSVDGQHTKQ